MKTLGKRRVISKSVNPSRGLYQDNLRDQIKAHLYSLYKNLEEKWDDSLEIVLNFWILSISLQHEEFISLRGTESIARLVFETNQMKKKLEREISIDSSIRHMEVQFSPLWIISPFTSKEVVSCLLGIQLDESEEILTKQGILSAIQGCSDHATLLDCSRILSIPNAPIQLFYLELTMSGESLPKFYEDLGFKEKFLRAIEERIQSIVPPLFMHRNEEEIYRDLLTLRKEISSSSDLPQVMVFYDKHSLGKIVFNVLMVRTIRNHSDSEISPLNKTLSGAYIHDGQVYQLGKIGEDGSIQGNVFQISLFNISKFQRKNYAVDYYAARREIIYFLNQRVGEVRDFNGGMLIKQGERLLELKEAFSEFSLNHLEFIENFFYSIRPIEKQAILPMSFLRCFFSSFMELFLESKDDFLIRTEKKVVVFAVRNRSEVFISELKNFFNKSFFQEHKVISSSWLQGRIQYHGYLLLCSSIDEAQKICHTISEQVHKRKNSICQRGNILRLGNNFVQFELDPRIGGTSESMAMNKLLFEGLTRIENGTPKLAAAKSYTISDDLCTYTFILKDLYWSNGRSISAEDFEYAWKQILSPNFSTRFAYLFYIIANAEEAKRGECSLDKVGIEVVNEKTLVIRLTHPVSYFLELLSISLYSPICREVDKENPSWSRYRDDTFVCNGPFRLKSPRSYFLCEMEPNPYYWNPDRVRLDGVSVISTDSKNSIQFFHEGELDWVGFPFGVPLVQGLKDSPIAETLEFSKVFWYCFNVSSFPLNNKKIRQALFYSVNRRKIIDQLGVEWDPAYSPLPLEHSFFNPSLYKKIENCDFSRRCFSEGCKELGISQREFPPLRLIYLEIELFSTAAIAFKDQIEDDLGISCEIEGLSYSDFFEKMACGDYQIGTLRWSSWVDDPLYTLTTLKNKNEKINLPKWEDQMFTKLISLAQIEQCIKKREELIAQAEKILIDDFVILPLGVGKDYIFRNPDLIIPQKGTHGMIDFSNAYFQKEFGKNDF